ncbi:MAG TPA: 4-hydroxybutyrate dehydrogenase [Clostridiales bacterium]|nr:4-hydroxybutyrate dehydrogenase [Clostridiales bacterium]
MEFLVKPVIKSCESLQAFLAKWQVNETDLIITNEYLVTPYLNGRELPCHVLYQERYGSGEPSDEMVDAMLDAVRGRDINRVIAIGGGTVIDISKLFVFGGEYNCEQIFQMGAELKKTRNLIIIPTTCGTGSEVTGISIVGFKSKGTKLGLAVQALYAQEAVLIPAMLSTLPYDVFATSSIDALIHAVESYVSPKATMFSRSMGRTAIEEILKGYMAMGTTRQLPANMTAFLEASTLAGIAFSNAGCAAVHAMSYPVGGNYHIPHGKANYMMFEAVYRAYKRLGADLSPVEKVLSDVFGYPVKEVWTQLFSLLGNIYDNQSLGQLGCNKEKCAEMAASVIREQQRLLANNPIELSEEQIYEIYLECL